MSLYDDMKIIQKEMLNVLGEFKNISSNPHLSERYSNRWRPSCDIIETKNKLIILIDMAGIDKENIHIVNEENFLRIYGERKIISELEGISYHIMEIESGKFERKIIFPNIPIDKKNPQVELKNGLLTIKFKIQESKKKKIAIE